MTEQISRPQQVTGQDSLYQAWVVGALRACEPWAHVMIEPNLDLLLWPRERGDFPRGIPYRVDQRIVERGVWRLTLVPAEMLPAGASSATRDALVRAQLSGDPHQLNMVAVDEVVQCGLFGEVLYREPEEAKHP